MGRRLAQRSTVASRIGRAGIHRQPYHSLALCVSLAPGQWNYREWHTIITIPSQTAETAGSNGPAAFLTLITEK
jgi:hypothetical protein